VIEVHRLGALKRGLELDRIARLKWVDAFEQGSAAGLCLLARFAQAHSV
jgi:hypothetical protein